MRLKPLYRMTFTYPLGWGAEFGSEGSFEGKYLFLAEGSVAGTIEGSLWGANHPMRRGDGTYLPDYHGVIETADGAEILFDFGGYGRAYPPGERQVVGWVTHTSSHERYSWLNDVVCAAVGEVRAAGDETTLVIDVAELVWEPLQG
jgi:Protein of unknown function (DUF3237)